MPNEATRIAISLIAPGNQLLFAIAFIFTWSLNRNKKYLLLVTGACITFSLGGATQVLLAHSDDVLQSLLSGGLFTASTLLTAEGIMRRYRTSFGLAMCATLFLLIVGLLWYFRTTEVRTLAHIYTQNFGYGAILLAAALRIQPRTGGKKVDRILYWTLLAFALQFFPRTLLTATFPTPITVHSFADSTFWHILQLSLAICGAALSLSVLAAAVTDSIEELRKERDSDPLTRLLNRRGLISEIKKCTDATGHLTSGSLILCDIDHFKRINDNFGHDTGDAILTSISEVLRKAIRSNDIAGRIGGEEFAIWLPETELEEASECAERLRTTIANTTLLANDVCVHVSASFGVAHAAAGESWPDLFKRADVYLYKAKRTGRNRMVNS